MPKVDTWLGAGVSVISCDGVWNVNTSTDLVAWMRDWTLTPVAPFCFHAGDHYPMRGGYKNNQRAARDLAITWSNYLSEHPVSAWDLACAQGDMYVIGKQYGLLTEFRENGIC